MSETNYAAPNPYTPGLTALRAAAATPESTFEDRYKAERLAALDAEYARFASSIEADPLPLRTAEAAFPTPDPYREGIVALQGRDARVREAKETR